MSVSRVRVEALNQLKELFLSEYKTNIKESQRPKSLRSLEVRHNKIKKIVDESGIQTGDLGGCFDQYAIADLFIFLEEKAIIFLNQSWALAQTLDLERTSKSIKKLADKGELPHMDKLVSNIRKTRAHQDQISVKKTDKERQKKGGEVLAEQRKQCRLHLIQYFDEGVKNGQFKPADFRPGGKRHSEEKLQAELLDFAKRRTSGVYKSKKTEKHIEIIQEHVLKNYKLEKENDLP